MKNYSMHYKIDYTKIKGVQVYLERYSKRIAVGELNKELDKYVFRYRAGYLNYKKAIPLGVEFPLTKRYFESTTIFESFWDRIPSKGNPAYSEYCKQFNISPNEDNIMVLLVTIGRKGPSSFIFEPVWEDSFSAETLKLFRHKLGLSTRDFASAFGISQATIVRIENNKASGLEVLKFLEIFYNFPDTAAVYYIEKYGTGLHSKTKQKLIKKLQGYMEIEDILTVEEVLASQKAQGMLYETDWGKKMLNCTSVGTPLGNLIPELEDKKVKKILLSEDIAQAKSKLFEIRFAAAIQKAGIAAEYEFKTGIDKRSVDFRINEWLIELTSLRISDAVKENTISFENFASYQSVTTPWDEENSPEVRDVIKAQQAILAKCIKFPEKQNSLYFHVIIVDMRNFNSGGSDFGDYINIVYGSQDLPEEYQRSWIDQNKQRRLITGIFDPTYPDSRAVDLQKKIHAVGFIHEKKFLPGEINSNIMLYANPESDTENIKKIWPLSIKA